MVFCFGCLSAPASRGSVEGSGPSRLGLWGPCLCVPSRRTLEQGFLPPSNRLCLAVQNCFEKQRRFFVRGLGAIPILVFWVPALGRSLRVVVFGPWQLQMPEGWVRAWRCYSGGSGLALFSDLAPSVFRGGIALLDSWLSDKGLLPLSCSGERAVFFLRCCSVPVRLLRICIFDAFAKRHCTECAFERPGAIGSWGR